MFRDVKVSTWCSLSVLWNLHEKWWSSVFYTSFLNFRKRECQASQRSRKPKYRWLEVMVYSLKSIFLTHIYCFTSEDIDLPTKSRTDYCHVLFGWFRKHQLWGSQKTRLIIFLNIFVFIWRNKAIYCTSGPPWGWVNGESIFIIPLNIRKDDFLDFGSSPRDDSLHVLS